MENKIIKVKEMIVGDKVQSLKDNNCYLYCFKKVVRDNIVFTMGLLSENIETGDSCVSTEIGFDMYPLNVDVLLIEQNNFEFTNYIKSLM